MSGPDQQTLSSDGEDISRKILARNTACHQCRKRKLKCDAIRPRCTNCTKPRPRTASKNEPACTWDEPKGPKEESKVRRREDKEEEAEGIAAKRAKLTELEARVAAFEKVLQDKKECDQSAGIDGTAMNPTALGDLGTSDTAGRSGNAAQDYSLSSTAQISGWADPRTITHAPPASAPRDLARPQTDSSMWAASAMPGQVDAGDDPNLELPSYASGDGPWTSGMGNVGNAAELFNGDGVKEDVVDNLFEIIWPDWPQDLPSLDIVEHIVTVFFEKIPTLPKMIPRASFMNSLQLPPTHANFPARSLLHAILAVTAPQLPPTSLATRAFFPVGASYTSITHPEHDFDLGNEVLRNLSSSLHNMSSSAPSTTLSATTPVGRFQMWHRRKAFQGLAREYDSGVRLLQALQAQVIATAVDQYNAWWTDLWMESGACMRMATPLRINESPRSPKDMLERFMYVLLGPAATQLEQAERDRTWWQVYLMERAVTMSTNWPETTHDNEITVELPVLQRNFDCISGELTGVQTLQSKDLFSHHPPLHVDGLSFYIKAMKLYADVNRFLRAYARGSHTIARYLSDPKLRILLSKINSLRLSMPAQLRRPTQMMNGPGASHSLDVDLVTSIMITHSATLSLGDPMITETTWNTDIAKMALSASRAILSLLYDITSTSYDLSMLPVSCSYSWFMGARALCRFVSSSTLAGDSTSASVFRSEISVFRMAMQQYGEKYPVGDRHVKMVDSILKAQDENSQSLKTVYDCTREQIFDTDYIPSRAAPSLGTGHLSSATPSVATPSNPESTNEHGSIQNITGQYAESVHEPSKVYWPEGRPVSNPPVVGDSSGAMPDNRGSAQPIAGFGTRGEGFMSDMGIDTSGWFDISNFAFDVDSMVDIANGTGALLDNSNGFGQSW